MPIHLPNRIAPLLVGLLALGIAAPAPRAVAQELTEQRRIEVAQRLSESTVSVSVGRSGGSGVLVGDQGWIVTNSHVVRGSGRLPVRLRFGDGTVLEGRVIADDRQHDLAVVQAIGEVPARPLRLADSDTVAVGQSVLAFGSPFGLAGTLTQGIVSARRDLPGVGGGAVHGLIQTDAPINPGNSGGPLVNGRGQIIGINTAILSRTGGSQGIGFAVPSNYVRDFLTRVEGELAERRRLARGAGQGAPGGSPSHGEGPDAAQAAEQVRTPVWLGILGDDVEARGLRGVRVRRALPGGPAADAGVRGLSDPPPAFVRRMGMAWTGHIILAVDGQPVRSMADLQRILAGMRPGHEARLTLTVGAGRARGEAVVQLEPPPRRATEGRPAGRSQPGPRDRSHRP